MVIFACLRSVRYIATVPKTCPSVFGQKGGFVPWAQQIERQTRDREGELFWIFCSQRNIKTGAVRLDVSLATSEIENASIPIGLG
jgi:hypothetical protein